MLNETALPKTPTVLGNWAQLLAQTIDSYELNSQQIFVEAGINLDAFKKPNSRVPAEIMTRAWVQAATLSQDPYIALHMAKYFQANAFSALGMGLSASRHVYEALQRTVRYAPFISDNSHCTLEEDERVAAVRIISRAPINSTAQTYASESFFSCLFKILQDMTAGKLQAKEVHFKHGFSGCIKPYEDFFGAPVFFSSHCNKLEFCKNDIFEEQAFSNYVLTNALDEWIERYLIDAKEEMLSTQVKQHLLENMGYGDIDLASVSKKMALGPRVIQRKLKQEGTSYSQVLENCRHELAVKLLSRNQRSLSEVAYMLGFSDQSTFSHSFRRWTGTSPSRFRGCSQ